MNIPEGMTEKEVIDIIDNIANRLAYKFKFGYHDIDDMKQQARMYAWQGIKNYDNSRPLENFLWTHVRNRLFNFKRDNYERPGLPCLDCPFKAYDPNSRNKCTKYSDKSACELYDRWQKRNSSRRNIMNPIAFANVVDEKENNMSTQHDIDKELDIKEFFKIIEKYIPIELKADLIRLKNDVSIPKTRREKVYDAIHKILTERGLNEPEAW